MGSRLLSRLAGPSAACPASACRTPLPCGPTTLRAAWVSPTATCSTFAKPSGPVNRLQDARMSVVDIPAAAAPRRPARLAPLRAAAVTTDGPATTASPDDTTATASPATAESASSSSAFSALGLIPELQSALAKLNIGEPTEIQVGFASLPSTMPSGRAHQHCHWNPAGSAVAQPCCHRCSACAPRPRSIICKCLVLVQDICVAAYQYLQLLSHFALASNIIAVAAPAWPLPPSASQQHITGPSSSHPVPFFPPFTHRPGPYRPSCLVGTTSWPPTRAQARLWHICCPL